MTADVSFQYYDWKPSEDNSVYLAIQNILGERDLLKVTSPIYTIAKDLLLNGIKANKKRIFFQICGLDIHHPGDYELGLRMFKSKLQTGELFLIPNATEDYGLWVQLDIHSLDSFLELKVTNNQTMVMQEIQKIRNSFLYAMNYDDIMEYYLERADDSEGEGIGIALIVILLKDLNVPLQNFTIENSKGKTIAKILFPWNSLKTFTPTIIPRVLDDPNNDFSITLDDEDDLIE